MNLDHDFVQVWKFSEDQKNKQMEHFFSQNQVKTKKRRSSSKIEHFFPQIWVKTKKKVFNKNRTLFSPNYAQMYTHSNYWGGCRCGPSSNYWEGYSQIIGGIYPPIPPPPCFGTPVENHFGVFCALVFLFSEQQSATFFF